MFRLVTLSLSIFILLSSPSVIAHPPRPSPLYNARRQSDATHAPAYLQPYHPGLAIPASPFPGAKPSYALSRRFIKDADYASGSSLPAFLDKSSHKRQLDPPDIGSTTVQFDNVKEQLPPQLPTT
ncbi:hypothetical protein BJV78DRAFT_1280536 [Lactifluus subvellereus]|nr:hypothetical protein BJV78DRAFT_1280536 [Lactifluus subvellereus]